MLPPHPPSPRVLGTPCKWSFSCCSTLRSPSSPIHEEDEEKLSEDSDSQAVLSGGELVLRETSSPEVRVCSAGGLLSHSSSGGPLGHGKCLLKDHCPEPGVLAALFTPKAPGRRM